MSPGGPSSLGALLVQRLDAVLGTTLSVQANIASGARPDAVSQPPRSETMRGTENDTRRHAQRVTDKARPDSGAPGRPAAAQPSAHAGESRPSAGQAAGDTAFTSSAPTSLGQAARIILALLARDPGSAPPLQGRAPLTPLPAPGAAVPPASHTALASQWASALAQTLHDSGMFYESHLARFTVGHYALAQLQREPQAAPRTPAPDVPHNPILNGIDPSTHTLVRQQLDALANQAIAWHGEAWQGAALEWETRREESGTEGVDTAGPRWHTRLAITLNSLGRIQASLSLTPEGLNAELIAEGSAVNTLRAHLEALRKGWTEQGFTPLKLAVAPDTAPSGQDITPS